MLVKVIAWGVAAYMGLWQVSVLRHKAAVPQRWETGCYQLYQFRRAFWLLPPMERSHDVFCFQRNEPF